MKKKGGGIMSTTIQKAPIVRVFTPDGNGGYIQWENLTDSGKKQTRVRVLGNVSRAYEIKHSAIAAAEHKAEVSKQVRELIDWLSEDA
jgi:hypothetical protein